MSRQLKFMVACQKRLNRCHFLSRHFLIYFDHWKRAGQLSVTSIVQNHAFQNRTTSSFFCSPGLNTSLSPWKISVKKPENDIKISIFWWFFSLWNLLKWKSGRWISGSRRGDSVRCQFRFQKISKCLEMGPFVYFNLRILPQVQIISLYLFLSRETCLKDPGLQVANHSTPTKLNVSHLCSLIFIASTLRIP